MIVAVRGCWIACAILPFASCSQPSEPAGEWEPIPEGIGRVDATGACIEGLFAAEREGVVDGQTTAMAWPWQIEQKRGASPRVIRCAVQAERTTGQVTVEELCPNSDDPECTRLIALTVGGRPVFPALGNRRD